MPLLYLVRYLRFIQRRSSSSVPYSLVRTLAARQTTLLQAARSFIDSSNLSVDKFVYSLMSLHYAFRGLHLPLVLSTISVIMHFFKFSSFFSLNVSEIMSFLAITELHNFHPPAFSKMFFSNKT